MLENMLTMNSFISTGILILEIGVLGKLFSLLMLTVTPVETRRNFRTLIDNVAESILKSLNLEVRGDRFLVACIFFFSLVSSVMTLVYSEVFLQEPCSLCWWQRIFMYGITVLSAQALWVKETKSVLKYIFTFSVFGLGFALYQHAQQMLALYGTKLPCPVSGVDCSKMTIFEYGHITFPWMAVVLFAFFIVIILLQKKIAK